MENSQENMDVDIGLKGQGCTLKLVVVKTAQHDKLRRFHCYPAGLR